MNAVSSRTDEGLWRHEHQSPQVRTLRQREVEYYPGYAYWETTEDDDQRRGVASSKVHLAGPAQRAGWAYAGWMPFPALAGPAQRAGWKGTTGTLPLRHSYSWGRDVSQEVHGAGGVGGLLAIHLHAGSSTQTASWLPSYDGNGNILGWTNGASGTIGASVNSDAYGNLLSMANPGSLPADVLEWRFSTKPEDPETGLVYYGYRWYSPRLGRWVSRDPIGERGGVNVAALVKNGPVDLHDVHGLSQALSLMLAWHWLIGGGSPVRIQWDEFDIDGSAASALESAWRVKNRDLLRRLCQDSPEGPSDVAGPLGARLVDEPFQNSETPFMSWWKGDVENHESGAFVDHDCANRSCAIELGLKLYAHDDANFNRGDKFGPGIPDDVVLWLQRNNPLFGTDYLIYAHSYTKVTFHVSY